jgi:ADP-ribosyl-[dinitrogen reductase] hydrolase
VNASGINLRDRFLGCVLGGAVGDALGAPYEGLWSHTLPDEDSLLTGFGEFEGYPPGQYTDDTQLSLATVESILKTGAVVPADIARSISLLWKKQSVIGPGGACTHAATTFLRTGDWTSCGAAVGQAGNGTAMRTAVLGLYFIHEPDMLSAVAADVSRITHQDPRSIAGGVAVAKAAQLLSVGAGENAVDFCQEIASTIEPLEPVFAGLIRELPGLIDEDASTTVGSIAWAGMERPEFDSPIITPFVIPTVLASLWCLLRCPSSWSQAVVSAIRLGGDVDTLGAIVGSLAGVKLGVTAIPEHLAENVVDSERLRTLAVRYHALVADR